MQACLPVLPSSREGPHPQAQPPTAFYVHSPAPISADGSTRQSKELKLEKMENGERRSFAFSILVSQYHNFPPYFSPLQSTCHTTPAHQSSPSFFGGHYVTPQSSARVSSIQCFNTHTRKLAQGNCFFTIFTLWEGVGRGTSFTPKYTNHSKTVYTRCTL